MGGLADQVGVMGIIDKLRMDEAVSVELADQQHRTKLVEKIRSAYVKEGASVTDEVINEGVNRWLDSRLRIKKFDEGIGWRLYLSREIWGKQVIGFATILVIGIGVYSIGVNAYDNWKEKKHAEYIAETSDELRSMKTEVSLLKERKTEIDNAEGGLVNIKRDIESKVSFDSLSNEIEGIEEKLEGFKKYSGDSGAESRGIVLLGNMIEEAKTEISKNSGLIITYGQFVGEVSEFKRRASEGEFEISINEFPQIKDYLDVLELDIKEASLEESEKIQSSIKRFYTVVKKANAAKMDEAKINRKAEETIAIMDINEEKKVITDLRDRLIADVMNLKGANKNDLNMFDYYTDIIGREIKLVATLDSRRKTVIERTYDATGGKSWYVICEAQDASGSAVAIEVESSEDQERKRVSMFGVGVSNEKFNLVKNDKKDDGIVDDSFMGIKKKGRIDFDLVPGTNARFIVRW